MVEESNVSEESRGEQGVAYETRHLIVEVLAALLPSDSFGTQVLDKLHATIDLLLNLLHVGLDGFNFGDEAGVFCLKVFNALLKCDDLVL
jgi:hypothetical protein